MRWAGAERRVSSWRRKAMLALALAIVTVAVPVRLSPTSAVVIGLAGLLPVVAIVLAGVSWRVAYKRALDAAAEALTDVLAQSEAVRQREERNETLTVEERTISGPLSRREPRVWVELTSRLLTGGGSSSVIRAGEWDAPLPLPRALEARIHGALAARQVGGAFLRIAGPAWLVLGFVEAWTSAALLVWAHDPAACQVGAPDCSGAFQGLSSHPTLGDFVYFVLNAALVNVLPDITARSPLAHALYSAIVISGIALLAKYATVLWTSARVQLQAAREQGSPSG
jgi:hypothetical protein